MKTLFKITLLLLAGLFVYTPSFAQKQKAPTSVAEAEKILAKKEKAKQKASKKALKQVKKNFANMQSKEFRKSLRRNEKRQRKELKIKKRRARR